MSLNACEAYLLEIRKDEIWQLMYVQRLSERKAYEKLVQKGLGWLGEQRFRDIVAKWECEEPEVWPLRPDYWSFPIGSDGRSDNHFQTCPECEYIAHRMQSTRGPILLGESSATNTERCPGLPSDAGKPSAYWKQSLAEGLEAFAKQPENPTANWLLTTPLGMNLSEVVKVKSSPILPNVPFKANYTSSVSTLCADCGEDHSSQPAILYDASSSYKERGSTTQRDSKPVSHIFGYIISPAEATEDSESGHSNKRQG